MNQFVDQAFTVHYSRIFFITINTHAVTARIDWTGFWHATKLFQNSRKPGSFDLLSSSAWEYG